MAEVCHDVCTEPALRTGTGERLSEAFTDDDARLDGAASVFTGGRHERACLLSDTMSRVRCTLSCTLRRFAIRSVRDSRSARGGTAKQSLPPVQLVLAEACMET